jgi:TM2 domain-containing membrane protein YozV
MLVEHRLMAEAPNTGIAYLLWFFLGLLGAHRFYLGQVGTGVAILILSMTGIGLVASMPWTLIDAILIPDMARQRRDALRQRFAYEAYYGYPYATYPQPPYGYQPPPPYGYPPQPPAYGAPPAQAAAAPIVPPLVE